MLQQLLDDIQLLASVANVDHTERPSIAALKATLEPKAKEKQNPKCVVCGTTKNIFHDGWYGYRCQSVNSMVF